MKAQRSYRYCVVDVFTNQPFEGNSLAVFPDASGLDDDAMQRIARELNLSETTFVFPATRSDCLANVRIFTPAKELLFCRTPDDRYELRVAGGRNGLPRCGPFCLGGESRSCTDSSGVGTAAPHLAAYSTDRIWQNVRAVSLRRHANSRRE
jgi:hypothetical protein